MDRGKTDAALSVLATTALIPGGLAGLIAQPGDEYEYVYAPPKVVKERDKSNQRKDVKHKGRRR